MQMMWLVIHIIGAIISMILLFSIVDQKDSGYKNRLFLAVICCVIIFVSRCLFIMATDESELLATGKLEYLGKCFANFFMLAFVVEYYKVKWPKKVLYAMLAVNFIVFVFIMTAEYHTLYYSTIDVAKTVNGYALVLGKGPLYIFYMAFTLIELVVYLSICFNPAYKKEQTESKKAQILMVAAGLAPAIMLGIYLLGLTGGFDTTPLGILISVSCFTIAITRYGLFDLVKNAKDVVVDNMDEGIIIISENMQFQYANPAACKMFPNMKQGAGKVDESEIQAIYEQAGTVIDLEDKSYEIRSSEIKEKEITRGYMLSIVDITDAANKARMMKELKDKAEHAALVKSAFLANMSHEIRTPMNAILGMAEMALHGNMGEEEQEYVEQIKVASMSLLAIINDILDFSKVESGKMEIVEADYAIRDMLKDLSNIVANKVKEKNLEFKITLNPMTPRGLYGDEIRIKQILINLVNNAVKFTEKGSVSLDVDFDRYDDDILLKVAVTDTGIGIREEDLARIFNSFEQSDTFRNRKKEGSGLGLAISKQLLTLMSGAIQVESTYQQGSRFYFEIPQKIVDEVPCGEFAAKEETKKKSKKEEYGNFKAPKAKVMIVDDNLVNLRVAVGLMRPFAMQVTQAKSGQEAIDYVKKEHFDIIFMDHMMPDMDGVEATHIIRQMDGEYYKTVPIIALTANAINGAKDMFLAEGLNDFIAKPISIRELSEKILDWLPFEYLEET